MSGKRIVNGQIIENNNVPESRVQQASNNAWSIINVVGLFFRTLINPNAENAEIEQRQRTQSNFPNPWQRQQRQRERNRERGRPLGNVKGVGSLKSVKHYGGGGGG
mmetsp:Transcript_18604/g.22868  ORF Transcript_18604/g.22868 Transcript_18604/m.22868 type:complete len:106 (+) Transcript_18604:58-375(+)